MAALRLPSEIQRLLAELFVKVPPSEIRVSTARAVKDWGPDLPTGGKSDGAAHGAGGGAPAPVH